MRFWEKITPAPVKLDSEADGLIVYTFQIIPSKGPYAEQELRYCVSFEKEENVPPEGLIWEFGKDTLEKLPKDQLQVITKAQTALESRPSWWSGLTLWTVLFFMEDETESDWGDSVHYEMLDLQDPEAAIKIMRTIESTVTTFIEKYSDQINAMTFSADTSDHGRIALYSRYTKMLEKQLGWKTLAGIDSSYVTQVFITYDEEALKAL